MADQRLRQAERLKKRKAIELLFTQGKSIKAFPLRLVFYLTDRKSPYPAQVAVTVPRKLYKRAVDRNMLKRRMRTAYQLHKSRLYNGITDPAQQVSLMIIYTSNQVHTLDTIEHAMAKAINILLDKYLK